MLSVKQMLLWFPTIALLLVSCSTAPILQSSRIRGKSSVGIAPDVSFSKMIPKSVDSLAGSNLGYTINKPFDTTKSLGNILISPFDALAISRRVELSGILLPVIFVNFWNVGTKICILDAGDRSLMLRNVGVSLIGSSNGLISVYGEQRWFNAAAGLIAGTSTTFGNQEFECTISPAIQYNWSREGLGEHDTTLALEIEQKCFSIGGGVFWYPWFKKVGIEFGIGGKYIVPYSRTIDGDYANNLYLSPYIFQLSIRKFFKMF